MSTLPSNLIVYTDGASRSNPGHAACAYLVGPEGKDPFKSHSHYLGDKVTNNQAEYRGMSLALAYLAELVTTSPAGSFAEIRICSDSKIVVEQINGNWKVKDHDLRPLCLECQQQLSAPRTAGQTVSVHWIPRDENLRADELCNQALDEAISRSRVRS